MLYELIVREFNYNKCRSGYIWCTDGRFIHPSSFKNSGKEARGYALDNSTIVNLKRNTSVCSWNRAKSYCTECSKPGKVTYLPDEHRLSLLYLSIMSGRMKEDLITAGLYEECNYRKAVYDISEPNWFRVWSKSEHDHRFAYIVDYNGIKLSDKSYYSYVIPFFKV